MAALTLRLTKGSELTYAELDGNFSALNADVLSLQSLIGGPASGAAVRVDSGNVGLGVAPSTWNAAFKVLEMNNGSLSVSANGPYLNQNATFNTDWRYKANGAASQYFQFGGQHIWNVAPSGTAGNAISFSQAMTLDAAGNLGLAVVPNTWNSLYRALQIGNNGSAVFWGGGGYSAMMANVYNDGAYRYQAAGQATEYYQYLGQHVWRTAASGSAGNAITFTQAMTLDAAGSLTVGPNGGTNAITISRGAGVAASLVVAGGNATPQVNSFDLVQDSGGTAYVYQRANSPLLFGTNNTTRGQFDASGLFGVNRTPAVRADINGALGLANPALVNAANYTVGVDDAALRITTTNCTVTLPAAASFPGRLLWVSNITANSLTSASSNVCPLGSDTAGTAILAATAGRFALLQSNGTNWKTLMAN